MYVPWLLPWQYGHSGLVRQSLPLEREPFEELLLERLSRLSRLWPLVVVPLLPPLVRLLRDDIVTEYGSLAGVRWSAWVPARRAVSFGQVIGSGLTEGLD